MTPMQKFVINCLLEGYNIAAAASSGYRLRNAKHEPVRRLTGTTFQKLKPLLRQQKGLFIIDKNKVRQQHGNSLVNKIYTTQKSAIKKQKVMERNTVATIRELEIGDRFYKSGDKNKVVYEKVDHEATQTHFQTYSNFATTASDPFPKAFKGHTKVVFLRHNESVK